MKAIVWIAANQLDVRDIPRPQASAEEALVRVSHVGICGSDLHIWQGEHPRAKPPLVLGHEFSGTVVEPAKASGRLRTGEAVVAYPVFGCGECDLCKSGLEYICSRLGLIGIDRDGGMSEFVSVPERKLHSLPPETDMAKAAMVEPVAVALHVLNRSNFVKGGTAAIIGAGPIGACIALTARAAGASQVFVSDVSTFRLEIMERFGLTAINASRHDFAEAVRDATGGKGAEFVFEATGIPPAAAGMQRLIAIGGRVVIVGIFPAPVPMDLRDIVFREITVVGTRHYTPEEFDRAIALVTSNALDITPLITDLYPIDHGAEGFQRAASGANAEKVLIKIA